MNSEEEGQEDQQEQQVTAKPEKKACESFQTSPFRRVLRGGQSTIRVGRAETTKRPGMSQAPIPGKVERA
jgi:hypothetical protein